MMSNHDITEEKACVDCEFFRSTYEDSSCGRDQQSEFNPIVGLKYFTGPGYSCASERDFGNCFPTIVRLYQKLTRHTPCDRNGKFFRPANKN